MLTTKESVLSLLANAVGFYVLEFFGGFLAFQMKQKYGIEKKLIGWVFIVISVPYLTMCFLLPTLNKKKTWSAKAQFIISFFLSSLGLCLAGPSKLFDLDDSNL